MERKAYSFSLPSSSDPRKSKSKQQQAKESQRRPMLANADEGEPRQAKARYDKPSQANASKHKQKQATASNTSKRMQEQAKSQGLVPSVGAAFASETSKNPLHKISNVLKRFPFACQPSFDFGRNAHG